MHQHDLKSERVFDWTSGMKRCTKCGELQPLDNFYRAPGGADGLRGDCKDCFRKRAAERYRQDPDKVKSRVKKWQQENAERLNEYRRSRRQNPDVKRRERDGHLRRKYGITADDYDRMLAQQEGGCAICGREPGDIALHVDHDPIGGAIRALLCFPCNNLLGDANDDPCLLRAAADYLDVHLNELIRRRAHELVASRSN
jgi:hypothetical protein